MQLAIQGGGHDILISPRRFRDPAGDCAGSPAALQPSQMAAVYKLGYADEFDRSSARKTSRSSVSPPLLNTNKKFDNYPSLYFSRPIFLIAYRLVEWIYVYAPFENFRMLRVFFSFFFPLVLLENFRYIASVFFFFPPPLRLRLLLTKLSNIGLLLEEGMMLFSAPSSPPGQRIKNLRRRISTIDGRILQKVASRKVPPKEDGLVDKVLLSFLPIIID